MTVSISNSFDTSIYQELEPIIENGFKKIEDQPGFSLGLTRTKSIEVALKILKNGKPETRMISLYQHRWSWLTFIPLLLFGTLFGAIYLINHRQKSTYSREKTIELIRKSLNTLTNDPNLTDSQLLSCVITANTANSSFSSSGYWIFFKDFSTKLCSYNFTR